MSVRNLRKRGRPKKLDDEEESESIEFIKEKECLRECISYKEIITRKSSEKREKNQYFKVFGTKNTSEKLL